MTTRPDRRRTFLNGSFPNRIMYHVIIVSLIQFLVTYAQGQGPGALNDQSLGESYHFYVDENIPLGKQVGKISVDPGTTVQISSRASSADHVYFKLDSHTGVLTTAKSLDRESLVAPTRPINIVILTVPPSLPIEMKITVNDVNDNHPKFPKSSYGVSFKEESDAKNKQTIPKAVDSDEGKNSLITNYSIVSGNEEGKFALIQEPPFPAIPRILYLQNIVKLNREETEFYQLNISATDHGNPALKGYLTVNITVADINDNYPTFHMSVYAANVNETAPPGTTVIQVEASDLDRGRNRDITYSMENNRDADQFEIHPYTGVVTTTKKLNCYQNKEKSCFITLLATDNGPEHLTGRAYLNIHIIDQNDHAPVIKFQHLHGSNKDYSTVNENAKNGTFVTIITVNDQDDGLNGKVSLSIIDGNQLGHFKLNTLHSVSVLEVVDNLDREKVHVYNLTLKAVDMGTPPLSSTAHLVIYVNDINDHPPQFDQAKYSAVLSERTPVGSFVTAVKAKDSDFGMNSQITYKIVSGNDLGWFHINSRSGLVTTVSSLDYEMSSAVILNISAQDGGFQPYKEYTTLNVTLHDINDMPPTFKKKVYNVKMDEGLSSGTEIIQLQAEDNDRGLNGTLRYVLHSDVDEIYPNCFHLNTTSGYLTTAKKLDREENEVYTIKVLAYDIGISPLTSTATVSLTLNDMNDNRPVFYPSKYYPKIYANHEENKTIMKVTATDRDADKNGQVTYQLTGGDVANFRIDADTGLVSVVGRLDPSVQAHYRLTISGQDGGGKTTQNTATAMITVLTTSDALPYFLGPPYSFSVTEDKDTDMSIGRVIGHVRAQITDPSANITLSIVDGDPNDDFSIDPYRGNIRTAKKIDRETKSSYTLRILASSNRRYTEVDVHIKVLDRNDNRPVFETGIVDVKLMENWPIGKEVYQASAVDLDDGINARITYSLRVNSTHPFMITHTGMIYLSQPLDKSPTKVYELTVIAVDSGTPQLSSSQTVKLHVQDVNDHTPVFASIKNSISLKESQPINDRFFLLSATDADEGKNKQISYSIIRGSEDGKFAIFPDGNLYIASELDRETKDFYHLTVVAEDQGIPSRSSSANITIQILDANDNSPVFSNQSYTMYVMENETPGKYIGTVHATDEDIGRNSELYYYLDGEEDNFAIDSRNGQITSRKSFDREELIKTGKDFYTFEVLVKDNGIIPLQSKTKVKVTVKDTNDNFPQFTSSLYKASISENAATNTSVTKVSATDADTNENQFLTYTITDGNVGDTFSINSVNGQIILMSTLDREKIDYYRLNVVAYDAGKYVQLNSSAEVMITVLDSNDNPPAFRSPPMSVELMETVIPGSLISQFHASDKDLGNNALLTFSIVDGNINDTFHVDGKSGKIYLMQKLDYEVKKVYHLNISVSDYGVPQLIAYQRFIIYVHDDNDNSPTFPENPVTFTIDEGTPVSTVIGTVKAKDPDTGINGEVRYRIASQSPPGIHFRIVNSGDILVSKKVDREKTRYFSLIVVATDNANPTSAQRSSEKTVKIVIRDVNDNSPKIVSPGTFVIPANSPVGTEVGRVEAIDLDSGENGRISYTLIPGDTSYFQMSSSSGVLTLRASLPAEKPILTLNIRVSDAGFADRYGHKATTTKVTVIASTDFSRGPRFTKTVYSKSLSEDVRTGTEVLKVRAQPENRGAVLEYYITRVSTNKKENPNGALTTSYFSLDKDSGQLTTNDSLDRDLGFTIISIEICAVERLDSTSVAVGKTQVRSYFLWSLLTSGNLLEYFRFQTYPVEYLNAQNPKH